MSARVWSAQQEAIFGWFAAGPSGGVNPNLIVRARAGTGKTTTILEGVNRAPEPRILVAAFNNAIAGELKSRIQNPNAEAKTLHGLGLMLVRSAWEKVPVCEDRNKRVDALVAEVCDGAVPDAIRRLVGKLCTQGRENATHAESGDDLVALALQFECGPDEEWEDLGYGLEFVCARAYDAMVLAAAKRPAEGIDFADMLYLPCRNRWARRLYDLVVVDEAQDMTVTQLEIAQGVCGGRICVVGDDRQAVYGFRGADSDSLDRLKAGLNAAELGLTVTYRCGRVIAERAAVLVPDLEAAPGNPEGEILGPVSLETMVSQAAPGDFILSRTNAPLAKVAMALLRSNRRARVLGKDIGAGLKALSRRLATGKAKTSIPAWLERLARWEEREVGRALAAGKDDQIGPIRDKAETLRVIADGVTGPFEMEARLEHLFEDAGDPATCVTCSSVHKAKGKEAARVFILRDTLYPKRPAKRDGPEVPAEVLAKRAREEQNIEYVAITRAIRTLVWVAGK